jgi:hypothetical protein
MKTHAITLDMSKRFQTLRRHVRQGTSTTRQEVAQQATLSGLPRFIRVRLDTGVLQNG